MLNSIQSNSGALHASRIQEKRGEQRPNEVAESNKSKVEEIKEKIEKGEYKLDMSETSKRMALNLLN